MPPELILESAAAPPWPGRLQWRMPLIRLAAAWSVLILLFLPVWAQMAHQWWNISTYNHILLVPLIIGWLFWIRRREIARLEPQAWWPGLIPLTGALLFWQAGQVSGIDIVGHVAVVGMLVSAFLLLLGHRVFAAALFPLAYMAFLVPFGDELVPPLQWITARICVALAHWSGIPATLDGIFIDTPAGLFRVAEACSGVMFLIAMVALGSLVAHLGFLSWSRRAAFMLFAIVLPVLANGVRAWATVFVAQYRGMEFAAGFDHIVFGWIFFAVVIALALGLAWRFFDRPANGPFVNIARINDSSLFGVFDRFSGQGWHALAMLGLIVLSTAAWSEAARQLGQPDPVRIDLQDVRGWDADRDPPREAEHEPASPPKRADNAPERMDRARHLS